MDVSDDAMAPRENGEVDGVQRVTAHSGVWLGYSRASCREGEGQLEVAQSSGASDGIGGVDLQRD
jgi:hypothetical protein